jgi:plastocyanin
LLLRSLVLYNNLNPTNSNHNTIFKMQYLTLLAMIPATMAAGYGYGSSDASSVAPVAAAQTSGASTSVKGVHVVKVGQNGLSFEPESMTVPVGETVEFHFWPKAHSVARSSFDKPCQPLNATSFWSGPVQVASGMSPTVFSVTVNDTNPIWYYCPTASHCQGGSKYPKISHAFSCTC